MDSEYCESINELLDTVKNWCLRMDELHNEAKIHSINLCKGDTAVVFTDNAKVTIHEFLESAKIAYTWVGVILCRKLAKC